MEIFRDVEVIFPNHMTNLLFTRVFRGGLHFFQKRFSPKIPTKKQIRHVIREDNLEITEYFHIRNPD